MMQINLPRHPRMQALVRCRDPPPQHGSLQVFLSRCSGVFAWVRGAEIWRGVGCERREIRKGCV
jgi:hypothetical protein